MSEGCAELALSFSGHCKVMLEVAWASGELAPVAWVGKAGGLTNSATSLAQIQVLELTLTSTICELLEHVLVLHYLHDSGQQQDI